MQEEFDRIRNKIRQIEKHKEQYRYNFIGLFGVAVNKDIIKREHAFFCSQFVATVMNEGDLPMFTISPSLVQPRHFFDVACLSEVYEGDLQTYLDLKRGQARKSSSAYEHVEVISVPFACVNGTFLFCSFRYSVRNMR